MKAFKTKSFARFARKEQIDDEALREALNRAERGLIDADLGGCVIKQRIARPGEGKSGGYRSILLFRQGHRAIFVHGYAKSVLANISDAEARAFKKAAAAILEAPEVVLQRMALAGDLMEL